MLFSLFSLLLLACSVIAGPLVDSSERRGLEDILIPSKTTNADRLKRGLPPLKPKRAYDPSPARRWNQPKPSGIKSGVLAVYDAKKPNHLVGYVQEYNPKNPKTIYAKVGPRHSAQTFTYPSKSTYPVAFSAGEGHNLALKGDHSNIYLTPTNHAFTQLEFSTVSTPAGSVPAGPNKEWETTVFSFNHEGEVTQKWVNPDKSTHTTTLELHAGTNELYATDNPEWYEKSTHSTPVYFKFVTA